MFIGHYGVSFVVRAVQPALPLWLLFLAVQLVDVVWAILVLLGIEKVRIVPGITATNPLDLYYMPFTHGLLASLLWALAAMGISYLWPGFRRRGLALLVGMAVFSHWLFDLLVHRHDLPLYADAHKVGLGLWNQPIMAFLLELALLAVGMLQYARNSRALSRRGGYGMLLFGLLMVMVQVMVFFAKPPGSDIEVAVSALVFYLLFAALAWWLERVRVDVNLQADDDHHQSREEMHSV